MKKPDHQNLGIYDKDIKWDEGAANDVLNLPEGLQMKIFAHDPIMKRIDCKVKFPKGYIVPRHTHKSWHIALVTRGRVRMVGEKDLHAGDVVFGWEQPHGPFEFLDDGEVFAVSMGEGTQHVWDKKEIFHQHTKWKTEFARVEEETGRCRVIYDKDVKWDEGAVDTLLTQPKGGAVKIYFHDPVLKLIVLKRKFPPGYVEPEHTHKSWHCSLLMKGRGCSGSTGMERNPGDYGFGWDHLHGPNEFPDGCEVFAVMVGEGVQHSWDEDRYLRYHTRFKAETARGKKAVARGDTARNLALEKKGAK
jgi:hypothetical protein